MKHFIESELLTDTLRELCGKYNIACGDDSQGLGKELMELPKRLSYLCTSAQNSGEPGTGCIVRNAALRC